MLSSGGEDNNNNNNLNKSTLSSSSNSTSSFSSRSASISPSSTLSLSGHPTHFEPPPKTMEEVWKDINLSSLHTPTGFRGVVLQDFLARPFPNDPVGSTPPPPSAAAGRPSLPVLNLNSDPDHHDDQLQFLGPVIPEGPNVRGPVFNVGPLRMPFDDVLMGENINGGAGLKRLPESGKISGGGERRHKRMIKNRESAARSRARKQAYTNELELEVERLKEENARLKKLQQQQQLSEASAAAADQFPKKSTLQRTSTAPF